MLDIWDILILIVMLILTLWIIGFRFIHKKHIKNYCIRTSDENEISLIKDYRNGTRYIGWSLEDFERQAAETEDLLYRKDTIILYDRSNFEYALEEMIRDHDALNGITWDTVQEYLDKFCKLDIDDKKTIKESEK